MKKRDRSSDSQGMPVLAPTPLCFFCSRKWNSRKRLYLQKKQQDSKTIVKLASSLLLNKRNLNDLNESHVTEDNVFSFPPIHTCS